MIRGGCSRQSADALRDAQIPNRISPGRSRPNRFRLDQSSLTGPLRTALYGGELRPKLQPLPEPGHGVGLGGLRPLAIRRSPEYDANVSSTKPILQVDPHSPAPLHDQVAAALRRAIGDGEAAPGERLPPARDLAAVLGVNANTVFRALRALRDEGLAEFRRGRGVTVTGEGPQRSVVVARARELVLLARRCGYRPEEPVKIIEQVA
jgi:GntR family transcriptional regulator